MGSKGVERGRERESEIEKEENRLSDRQVSGKLKEREREEEKERGMEKEENRFGDR